MVGDTRASSSVEPLTMIYAAIRQWLERTNHKYEIGNPENKTKQVGQKHMTSYKQCDQVLQNGDVKGQILVSRGS